MTNRYRYCESLTSYNRYKTRVVNVGDIPLGGENPIRIQSMTTTDTMNTIATVEQTIRMVESGCDYVRITAPSINEAKNLEVIKKELLKRGCKVPLIADIHFTPNAAETAARIVEKVRVNPGNYVDKKKFAQIEYSDAEYQNEIERIAERFSPLVKICKEYGTAMRIGTNHGSLSDRIMSRYGDTPNGMVESALEFVRICEDLNYYNIVLSMKASNPKVMIQAYRLLVNRMESEGMNYPLHLGVTEAGDGEDGRIKSAVGIGTLLEDGLGDTVRVSLTEIPEHETPVAIELVNRYQSRNNHKIIKPLEVISHDPFEYKRRETIEVINIGGSNVPVVVADLSQEDITYNLLQEIGYRYDKELDKWHIADIAPDYIFLGENELNLELPESLGIIYNKDNWESFSQPRNSFPLYTFSQVEKQTDVSPRFIEINIDDVFSTEFDQKIGEKDILVVSTNNTHAMAELRRIFFELEEKIFANPVIIKGEYKNISEEQFMLYSSTDAGALLADGFGDGIWLKTAKTISPAKVISTSFGILQATRTRISKTEYIACPSCGRTLFDLVEVTNKIRERTGHLKGVKIGIMGCIVNGPGEMADADYGYVGSGVNKITLYRGKEVVKKNVNSEEAVGLLIELIKEDGNWIDSE
jgi:(E)-4-hydroxy-3-methylbut-2-enyl-diphosphate synthase